MTGRVGPPEQITYEASQSAGTAAAGTARSLPPFERRRHALPRGGARASLRRYAASSLRGDATVVGTTVLASYAALQWPTLTYLLLLTAVAANMWYVGRMRVLPITLGTIGAIAWLSPPSAAPQLRNAIDGLPHVVLFVVVVLLVGAATEALRRAGGVAERHAAQLRRVNDDLEQRMEEVQCLSDELHEANIVLTSALADAERTAERVRELQAVTAALSLATTVPDVATVVLTRGVRAVRASRGRLLLATADHPRWMVAATGSAQALDGEVRDTARDEDELLDEAMRERRPVWIAASGAPLAHRSSTDTPSHPCEARLALPLLHGENLVGGLSFDFTRTEAPGDMDVRFTALLAQATADALSRAHAYDEEREARRAAELMSRAREEVLGIVAHDLRNPLHLVSSSAYLLAQPDLSTERREAVFAATMRAVQRMNRLIGDLLDSVRMETGRLTLDHHACEVNRLLSQGAEAFYPRAHGHGIVLEVVDGPDVVIEADEARVLQVIDNLVDNALKFTPQGGRIVVSGTVHGEYVHIAVSDTGPGIPEAHLARLFDRFWQARRTDRRGIGIGLTTARGIAEAHGGRLWVESIVGHGSTFVCALPMRATAP